MFFPQQRTPQSALVANRTIHSLPDDTLYDIAKLLAHDKDPITLFAFMAVCKRFNRIAGRFIFQHDYPFRFEVLARLLTPVQVPNEELYKTTVQQYRSELVTLSNNVAKHCESFKSSPERNAGLRDIEALILFLANTRYNPPLTRRERFTRCEIFTFYKSFGVGTSPSFEACLLSRRKMGAFKIISFLLLCLGVALIPIGKSFGSGAALGIGIALLIIFCCINYQLVGEMFNRGWAYKYKHPIVLLPTETRDEISKIFQRYDVTYDEMMKMGDVIDKLRAIVAAPENQGSEIIGDYFLLLENLRKLGGLYNTVPKNRLPVGQRLKHLKYQAQFEALEKRYEEWKKLQAEKAQAHPDHIILEVYGGVSLAPDEDERSVEMLSLAGIMSPQERGHDEGKEEEEEFADDQGQERRFLLHEQW